MKKIITTVLAMTLALGSFVGLAGCKGGNTVKGGTEAVKLLLAKERLDDKALKQNYRFWEEDAYGAAAVHKQGDLNGEAKSTKANVMEKSAFGGLKTVSASADYFLDGNAGYAQTDEYSEWNKFPVTGAAYNSFSSFLSNIELEAQTSASIIAKMKKDVGITDKWVQGIEHEYTYMLQVYNDAEYLYRKKGDEFKQTRRYTREDAKNVYESFSYYQYDDGTTGDIRSLYIPGEQYEYMYENSGGFKDYVIVENSRGYWTFMRMNTMDGTEFSFDVYVMKDGVGYNAFIQILGEEEKPQAAWYTVFDPVEGREYFRYSQSGTAFYEVALEAFDDGLKSLRAYGVSEEDMYTGRQGHEFEHGYPVTVVAENGEIAAGTALDGVTYTDARIVFDPMTKKYSGQLRLEVESSGIDAHVSESLLKLQAFFSRYGLETHYDIDEVVSGVTLAELLTEEFGNAYSWNGYPLNSLSNANAARAELLAYYQEVHSEYQAVKNYETVKAKQKLDSSVQFAAVANLNVGETAYADGKVTASGLTLSITDTTLLESGKNYQAVLGLAKIETNGSLSSVNTIALGGGTPNLVAYETGEIAFIVNGEYQVPKNLCEGQYALVVYVATEDGLRVSELKKLPIVTAQTGALQSEAMAVTVAVNEEMMTVDYAVQLSVWATIDENRAYTGSELQRALLRVALMQGYPKDEETLQTENGEAVDLNAALQSGVYKLKIYLPTADGISEAYVYCQVQNGD